MKRVIVHIDRLRLDGFRGEDRNALAAGLQHELQSAFADPQVVAQFARAGDTAALSVGIIHVKPGAAPGDVGASVARGIGGRPAK